MAHPLEHTDGRHFGIDPTRRDRRSMPRSTMNQQLPIPTRPAPQSAHDLPQLPAVLKEIGNQKSEIRKQKAEIRSKKSIK